MIPITRKENYLNEIVGWGETAPEKPLTPEEFFFAAILGEAVQTPEPLSRYQIYLAKIAGRNISVPKPLTRIELFLAKACGMDIETPTPITREEMFWADYALIVEKELSGIPPLTFNAVAGTLKNYRIYGNTVNGESVGDRTANLIQGSIKNANIGNNGKINPSNEFILVYAPVVTGESYTISNNSGTNVYAFYNAVPSTETATSYDSNRQIFSTSTITFVSPITGYIAVRLANTAQDIMINPGSTALPYEPYGYKVPVTVEGINILPMSTTPISTDVDDFHCEYDGAGTITLTTDKDNAVLNSFSIPLSEDFIIPVSIGQGGDGCAQFNNSISTSLNSDTDHIRVNFHYNSTFIDNWGLTTINRRNSTYISMGGKTINRVLIDINGVGFSTNRKIVIRPAFVLNTTEQVPFEPYHAPITTPIYLPEQIRKVGDEAEYVDYATQKKHRVRKNLFNETIYNKNVKDNTLIYVPIYVGNVDYVTCSTTCPKTISGDHEPFNSRYIFILSGDVNTGAQNVENGVSYGAPRTIQPSNGYVTICYRKIEDYDVRPWEYQTMLNVGSTPLTYEPYIENTDIDVTLPALPTIKGTNVLSVGTAVQPSKVYVKYKGERQ